MEPLTLITGAPGHGKTLLALQLLQESKAEGLKAYHFNCAITDPDFSTPLEDLTKWNELPEGSVLLIDEAQEKQCFPKRPTNQQPPAWIELIARIRHFGIRMLIVTQDPRDIDHFVRRRLGVHYHVARKTGHAFAIRHEWRPYQDNPRTHQAEAKGERTVWKYPKELYQVYQSSTQHMVKTKIPKAVWVILIAAVSFVVLGYAFYQRFMGRGAEMATAAETVTGGQQFRAQSAAQGGLLGSGNAPSPWASAQAFADHHAPLIRDIPWSAPVHANLNVTTVPDLHCVIIGDREKWSSNCKCYTEQITPVAVDGQLCRRAALNGVYNPYRPNTIRQVQDDAGDQRRHDAGPGIVRSSVQPISDGQGGVRPYAAPPPVAPYLGVR